MAQSEEKNLAKEPVPAANPAKEPVPVATVATVATAAACITTYTGRHFDPTAPDPELIDLRDVAHALSLTCRGNGHVKTFFSVGQHCLNCAKEAEGRGYPNRLVKACLIHDASEAYMSDVPRPFKKSLPSYREAEDRLLDLIYGKYLGSTLTEEEQRLVKEVDDDMLYFDLKVLLNDPPARPEPEIHIDLSYEWVPFEKVEEEYLSFWKKLEESCD